MTISIHAHGRIHSCYMTVRIHVHQSLKPHGTAEGSEDSLSPRSSIARGGEALRRRARVFLYRLTVAVRLSPCVPQTLQAVTVMV